MSLPTIGILGAGKLGTTLAQLARKAGYSVLIAGSGSAEKIALAVDTLAPGAVAGIASEVAHDADIIILALPLSRYRDIPREEMAGKLVIDAMNYWWEVDGPRDDLLDPNISSSEAVQQFLPKSRVVKALSHMSYHDLFDNARLDTHDDRVAFAVAGGTETDVKRVEELIERLGFDVLYIGNLERGRILEPGGAGFGVSVPREQLREMLLSSRV